jgi:hypothetical protein
MQLKHAIIVWTIPTLVLALCTNPVDAQPVCDPGGPYSGDVGNLIQFDGSGSYSPDGEIVSYQWSFGDGSFGEGPSPKHAYASSGIFIVGLLVTDNNQTSALCETTATVSPLAVEPRTWGWIKAMYR